MDRSNTKPTGCGRHAIHKFFFQLLRCCLGTYSVENRERELFNGRFAMHLKPNKPARLVSVSEPTTWPSDCFEKHHHSC